MKQKNVLLSRTGALLVGTLISIGDVSVIPVPGKDEDAMMNI